MEAVLVFLAPGQRVLWCRYVGEKERRLCPVLAFYHVLSAGEKCEVALNRSTPCIFYDGRMLALAYGIVGGHVFILENESLVDNALASYIRTI